MSHRHMHMQAQALTSGPTSKCVQPQHSIRSLLGMKVGALGKDWHIQTGDFCVFKKRKRKKDSMSLHLFLSNENVTELWKNLPMMLYNYIGCFEVIVC